MAEGPATPPRAKKGKSFQKLTSYVINQLSRCGVGAYWAWLGCGQNVPEVVQKKLAPMIILHLFTVVSATKCSLWRGIQVLIPV